MSHPGDQSNLLNSDGSINARGVIRYARYRFAPNDSIYMTKRERASELRYARRMAWDRANAMWAAHPANREAVVADCVTITPYGKQIDGVRRSAF